MRTSCLTLVVIACLGGAACSRQQDRARHDEPAAREAGRDAYRAGEDIKRGAKEAAHEAERAGKEFTEGWKEARRDDHVRDRRQPESRPRDPDRHNK